MSNNIYLGKRVRDIGKKGLSNKKEFMEIIKEILEDYKKGKISKATAKGRLLLLYKLTYKTKNKNLRARRKGIYEIRKMIKTIMSFL